MEFILGSQKGSFITDMKTGHSCRPSGSNPNFLTRLVRPIQIPCDPTFAPALNVIVKDSRLGKNQ